MKLPQTLEEVLKVNLQHVHNYAKINGWEKSNLEDPVEDMEIFFQNLKNNRMLDVGCGWGRYVSRFLKKNLSYQGIDFSSEMLKEARRRNPGVNFVEGSYTKLPFGNDYFDGLWSCCSLSGIPKAYLAEALLEHRRVLKPDGIMMIVMPALMDNSEGFHQDETGELENYEARYFLDEFERYLCDTGFGVIKSGHRFKHCSMYTLVRKSS